MCQNRSNALHIARPPITLWLALRFASTVITRRLQQRLEGRRNTHGTPPPKNSTLTTPPATKIQFFDHKMNNHNTKSVAQKYLPLATFRTRVVPSSYESTSRLSRVTSHALSTTTPHHHQPRNDETHCCVRPMSQKMRLLPFKNVVAETQTAFSRVCALCV